MNEPPRRTPYLRSTALIGVLLGVVLAIFHSREPIAPRGDATPADEFSEARAMPVVRTLATDIGLRPSGSAGLERAARYLEDALRALPRFEVEVQHVSESRVYDDTGYVYPLLRYHVTNVIARLPGRTRDAVLLDAHFDTLGDSPGAGDDALGIAGIVEAARALSVGPTLDRSVIVLCNGGEEYGLFGADGFIRRHPLASDVTSYVYLDGSPGGGAQLLYAGPGAPGLVDAWARSAPRPVGSSLTLDLLDANILPQDGDFRPFRDAGKPGLSFAAIGDLWAAHTARDTFERLQPGTLQHMGESTLAVTRELANAATSTADADDTRTYFDVFGLFVVRYGSLASRVFGLAALLLAAGALVSIHRSGVETRGVFVALGGSLVSFVVGVLVAALTGALLAFVLQRPHGWYSSPWLMVPTFLAPAVAGTAFVQARIARRLRLAGHDPLLTLSTAALVGWSLPCLLTTISAARSGYVPLAFTLGLAGGLLAMVRWPERRFAIAMLATLPGFYAVAHVGPFIGMMGAEMAFFPLPIPADPILGVLVSLLTVFAAAGWLLPSHAIGDLRVLVLSAAALALAGVILTALHPPFDARHPRRVFVVHGERDGKGLVTLRGLDGLPLDPILEKLTSARPAPPDVPSFEYFMAPATHVLDAPVPSFAPPELTLVESTPHADGTRTLKLHVGTATTQLRMFFEKDRVVRWSLDAKVPAPLESGERPAIYFMGVPSQGEELEVTVKGSAPVAVELTATSFLPDAVLDDVAAKLPEWAVVAPMQARTITRSF